MHVPVNVKSPYNISKWQMGFNSAFKGLRREEQNGHSKHCARVREHIFIYIANFTLEIPECVTEYLRIILKYT